jgi:hypothetical protein
MDKQERSMINRRRFLRGMMAGGVITVQLPILELFMSRKALASDGGFPQRFGMFFWGNGNRPDQWTPIGEGDEWELSDAMEGLINFKDEISVVSGMSIKVPNVMPHWSGAIGFLTGQTAVGDESDWTVGGPTIDQLLAQEIGGDTVFRSLVTGCVASSSISWNGPNSRNPVESDPYLFYEKLFGPTFREPGEEGIVDPRLGYRRSVLDSVMQDIDSLNAQLGSSDKQRLEQHLDGIRELETRLARLEEDPPAYEACSRPEEPLNEYPDIDSRPQLTARNAVMSQMIAMALACDQTRVISYEFTNPLNNLLYPSADSGHHNLTHNEAGEQPQVQEITKFNINEAAVLLEALRSVPEGDGTLLDNCGIIITSEVSEGRTHSLDEFPLILAGSVGGQLKQGYHYRSYSQENANKFSLSVIRAYGVSQLSWGADESETTDGLSSIEV